jgi:SAM-dependent methyltransferase
LGFPRGYHVEDGIWVPDAGARDVAYDDGDPVEEGMGRILAGLRDRSVLSAEVRGAVRDPATRYYLSPRRANLLRPFAGALRGRVLEVGAGCGSITRYLGELGGDVTAVEGTRRRAGLARARTADLANVRVVWEDAARLAVEEPHDVLVLVGVLEYARVILGGAEAQARLLRHARGLLRPGGLLLLAIENQIGCKYWAGAPEDHYGAPFFGLQDGYDPATVATFGRRELAALLEGAGFPHQAWYVPVPDYKVPAAILSPEGLRRSRDLGAAAILAQNVWGDERGPARPLFSLEQAWSVLERNGLLLDFANSFLVAAAAEPGPLERLGHGSALAWLYAVDRPAAFARESCIREAGGALVAERRPLAPQAPAPPVPVAWRLYDEPWPGGDNAWCDLAALVTKRGWGRAQVAAWGRRWLEAVFAAAGLPAPQGALDPRQRLPGHLLEATPLRLWWDGATGRFVDLEWELPGGVELGLLAIHALGGSLGRLTSITWSDASPPPTPAGLLRDLCADLGIALGPEDWPRYGRAAAEWQAWLGGGPAPGGAG